MDKVKKIFENFIFAAIILVVIQTFLDDFSRYSGWSVRARNILLVSGFIFDFIFTIEFTVRTVASSRKRKFWNYFWYNRGWVDLLSSLPLLLLNSGPAVFVLVSGSSQSMAEGVGVFSLFKIIKAVRVARILRLIRVVKIFGKIHNTDSKMAQHHTAVITSTAVFSIILTLIFFSFIGPGTDRRITEIEAAYAMHLQSALDLTENNYISPEDAARMIFKYDKNVILLKHGDEDIIVPDQAYFHDYYDSEDYKIIKKENYEMYVSFKDINADIAFSHIQSFGIIIVIVLAFAFIYTKHFAQTISDVAHILNLGLRKKDYMLQIKINKNFSDHEIFRLAKFYNDAYLPAKMKKNSSDKSVAAKSISMKDLMGFNRK